MPGPSLTSLAGSFLLASFPLAAQAQDLPEGAGKELVEAVCTGCHQTSQITRSSGYTRDGWQELTSTMIDLSGEPGEHGTPSSRYLAEHFAPNTAAGGDAGPGRRARSSFKEWQVPTLGQRARDPVEAPDGSIWWAGQFGNLVGRIDPATGGMKEYPLPAECAAAHGGTR